MQQGDVVLGLLAPTYEDAAKAVHPTVGSLHHPTPRLLPGPTLEGPGLFAARADVGREPELLHDLPYFVEVIAFVQTQPLRFLDAGLGPVGVGRYALQGGAGQFHVVAVGPVHGHADGDALGLDQQAALDALLGPIRGVLARLFPPRGAPWSCTRPSTATTSRCLCSRRRSSGRPPTSSGRRRPPPILGSGRGPWTRGRRWWRPGLSTDSRCGGRRGWPPCRSGRPFAAARRFSCVGSFPRLNGRLVLATAQRRVGLPPREGPLA